MKKVSRGNAIKKKKRPVLQYGSLPRKVVKRLLTRHMHNTTKQCKWYVHNHCVGSYNLDTQVFSKYENSSQRFRNLSAGPGHGFLYEIYQFLLDHDCQRVRIQEGMEAFEMPFSAFKRHMEIRTIRGETKVFCSMKWFMEETQASEMRMNDQLTMNF